jgi:hypothetical protein
MAGNVSYLRPELSRVLPQYYMIRDCIEGADTIKRKTNIYLPIPNAEENNSNNLGRNIRYANYLRRAVFYNVTRRTLLGLCGQIFMREPIIKVPTMLNSVIEDATGAGISIEQIARKSVQMTLAYSRSGLLVDYPDTTELGGASVADIEAGNIRPTMMTVAPTNIVNWRCIREGAKEKLSLIVIWELFLINDDGFETSHGGQFRVMFLDDQGNYQCDIWREEDPTSTDGSTLPDKKKNFEQYVSYYPTGSDGERLKYIPFMFIGAENNDSNIDDPAMYDLASLNISHYCNSADYEEACFIVGQPTVVVSGLTQEWLKDQLKGTIAFGARGGIPLPVGATAELLQAMPNTMIKEAMDTKERQMVALGARLVEQKQVQRTAFETKVEASNDGSILSQVSKNVSEAYEWALGVCADFMGMPNLAETAIQFELNDDFDIARMTPEEQAQAIANWQKGAITWEEMRDCLRKAGVATVDDDKAKAEIEQDTIDAMKILPNNIGNPLDPGNPTDPNKPAAPPAQPLPKAGT